MILFAITLGGGRRRGQRGQRGNVDGAPENAPGTESVADPSGKTPEPDGEDENTVTRPRAPRVAQRIASETGLRSLEETLAERERFIAVQHAELETAIEAIREQKAEREATAKRIARLESSLERRKDRIAKLQEELEQARAELANRPAADGAVEASAQSRATELLEQVQRRDVLIETYEQRLEQALTEMAELQGRNAALEQTIAANEADLEQRRVELESTVADEQRTGLNEATPDDSRTVHSETESAAELATLRFDLQSKMGIAHALETIAAQEADRLELYERHLEESRARRRQLRAAIEARTREIEALRREAEDWDSAVIPMEAALAEREASIASLRASAGSGGEIGVAAEKERALDLLGSAVARWRATVNPLRKALRQRNARIGRLEEELGRRSQELQRAKASLSQWMQRVGPLRATLIARNDKIARLKADLQNGRADSVPRGAPAARAIALPASASGGLATSCQLSELRARIADKAQHIATLEDRLHTLTGQLELAGQELRMSQSETLELEVSLREHDDGIASVQAELARSCGRSRSLAAEIEKRDAVIKHLRGG